MQRIFVTLLLLDCPSSCQTCTSATICESCNSGFRFENNQCITCVSGQYVDEGTCVGKLNYSIFHIFLSIDCPSTCETCSSASQCQACKTDYALYQDQCTKCPSGTYTSGSNCISK